MTIPLGFISAVQNVFPDFPSLNRLLFNGEIIMVQVILQAVYKDFELTPDVVLSLTDIDTTDGVKILRVRARKARDIKRLIDEAASLVFEEKRLLKLEDEAND